MVRSRCRIQAPTKHVVFHQNIGMLVLRKSETAEGNFCKRCIHQVFWKMTGTNLLLGWWGYISFFVNIFFILNNIASYASCLTLEPPGRSAGPGLLRGPALDEDALARLEPFASEIAQGLGRGEALEDVAFRIGPRAGVTAAQVMTYARARQG